MPSRPEYLAAWLGITKVGGVVALVNTRLVGASLSHCINVADAGHVILAADLGRVRDRGAAPDRRAEGLDSRRRLSHPGNRVTYIDPVLGRMDESPLTGMRGAG